MKVTPYMSFEGNAEEAITFYAKALNGKIGYTMRYGDAPDYPVSESYKNKLMHAQLEIGNDLIYVSDVMENTGVIFGRHLDININFDSVEQLEKAYAILAEEAKEISMALADTFWNAKFGSLIDKYGFGWSLNYSYPEEK